MHRLERFYFDIPGLKPGSLGAYGFSVALVGVATALRLAIDPYVAGVQYITYFPAVIITTLICGARAGLLSVLLCAAAAYYFVLPPQGSVKIFSSKEVLTIFLFVFTATVDVALIGALRFAIRRYRELSKTLELRVEARTKELLQTQERLVQSQKMEALGQLTGGMAHDFNNMLGVVIGNLDMARRRLASGESNIARYVENALEGARRAATLTQRLLAFARRQPLQPISIDVNKLVSGASELLRRTLEERVEIECVLGAGLWKVHADPAQLESAIVNLVVNARDAMPEGGSLTLETANSYLDEQYASTRGDVEPGQYVMVAVSDTGSGMDEHTLAKATEPFFTTKGSTSGTGLGLSQVYGFAKQSGGHFALYSEVDRGTTAKLYLPRSMTDVEQNSPRSVERADKPARKAVVLLVEDDERVRRTTAEVLHELGHDVIEASDGAEALRILEDQQHVDLLFTDVVMPGMDGHTLAKAAHKLRPALRILYSTGYTRNAIVHNGTLDAGVELLVKPFTFEEVERKLNKILA